MKSPETPTKENKETETSQFNVSRSADRKTQKSGAHTCVGVFFPRYHCVLNALSQQNSELRDTRMLTEFLERVELEESQELERNLFSLGQVS